VLENLEISKFQYQVDKREVAYSIEDVIQRTSTDNCK